VKKYIKNIIFGVVSFTLMFVAIFEIESASEETMKHMPVTNKVIILDAGHGGIDPGKLSNDKLIQEKDVNLSITLKLRELLESSGAVVVLTREDDSSLYVEDGNKKEIGLATISGYSAVIKKSDEEKFRVEYDIPENLTAPIDLNQAVGNVKVYYMDDIVFESPLYTIDSIKNIDLRHKIDSIIEKWF